MTWFEDYMMTKKFKGIMCLGVFDARDTSGWFIDNSNLFERIYLVDNYDFSQCMIAEDPVELKTTVYNKIQGKQNIDFIIEDGNLVDYTKLDFDFAMLDCDSITAVEKMIEEKPDIVFCIDSFLNGFHRTNEVFEWMNSGKIFPFLLFRNDYQLFFTADWRKQALYYEEACDVDFHTPHRRYETYQGCKVVSPRFSKTFYLYASQKL